MKALRRMWGNKGILEVLWDHEHTRLVGGGVDRLMGKVGHKVAWNGVSRTIGKTLHECF